MFTIMKYLLLLCMALPYLASAVNPAWINGDPNLKFPNWGGTSLEVCDNSRCRTDGAAAWINFTAAQNNLNAVCANLVGDSGQIAYVADERRNTCIQILRGENAYKWNFDIHRNRCSDHSNNLDFHTCFETLGDILSGYVTFCSGGRIWVIGGHEQVGCFMISSSAQPGWCADSLPWGAL